MPLVGSFPGFGKRFHCNVRPNRGTGNRSSDEANEQKGLKSAALCDLSQGLLAFLFPSKEMEKYLQDESSRQRIYERAGRFFYKN
jgi:hypothetical protein